MELYFTISIVDRARSEAMLSLLHANKVQLALTLLGKGTAQKEHLLLYGLEATEKAVICAVIWNLYQHHFHVGGCYRDLFFWQRIKRTTSKRKWACPQTNFFNTALT